MGRAQNQAQIQTRDTPSGDQTTIKIEGASQTHEGKASRHSDMQCANASRLHPGRRKPTTHACRPSLLDTYPPRWTQAWPSQWLAKHTGKASRHSDIQCANASRLHPGRRKPTTHVCRPRSWTPTPQGGPRLGPANAWLKAQEQPHGVPTRTVRRRCLHLCVTPGGASQPHIT